MQYQVIKIRRRSRKEPDNYLPMHQISDIIRDQLEEFRGIKYILTHIHSEYCFLEIWVINTQIKSVLNILQEDCSLTLTVEETVSVVYSKT